MPARPEPGGDALEAALVAVARAIGDSLELRQVWDRVAEACRAVVPFDGMGVSRVEKDGRVVVIGANRLPFSEHVVEREYARAEYSPRLWPEADDYLALVHDAAVDLDQDFAVDRDLVARGYHSVLRVPLGRGQGRAGSLILTAAEPRRFTEEHGHALCLVAELVGLALAHEQLARTGRERRRRRDTLDRLLPPLATTLDVRAVFEQISHIAQEVIPHDYMSLGLLSEDRKRVRMIARFGTDRDATEMPDYIPSQEEIDAVNWDYFLARDHTILGPNRVRAHLVQREPSQPATLDMTVSEQWMRGYTDLGIRSSIRAPIRWSGKLMGGMAFMSRRPDRYDEQDAEFAVRVADHVALALAHQELAEESRRAGAARDRALRLEDRVRALVEELETLSPHRALGRSRRWHEVLAQATRVAPTDTTVLLTGESGTGKEVVARFIHRGSARKDGPFVALNCAALPEPLLESELFGHDKGAFTGAVAARPGKIEQAAGGVLFLDEVGEMSPAVQAKFLRVLQEREYERLGGTRTLKADVRVLAATNRDLKAAIAKGAFREDLYYRLAVFDIPLPPLRERREDILLLVDAFVEQIGGQVGRPAAGVSEEAREKLVAYSWPGNVRELRNAIERAVILCEGGLVASEHLPKGVAAATGPPARDPGRAATAAPGASPPAAVTLGDAEREMIVQALARAGNNKSKAARLLGLTRAQLRSRLERHGITAGD